MEMDFDDMSWVSDCTSTVNSTDADDDSSMSDPSTWAYFYDSDSDDDFKDDDILDRDDDEHMSFALMANAKKV